MSTYHELLIQTQKQVESAGYSSQIALLYLVELLNAKNQNLYLQMEEEIDLEIENQYKQGIQRMLENEPYAYVLGYSWFYGYQINVNEHVLIPRPETEELVANILQTYDAIFEDHKQVKVADIGTGSGAIAIALAKEEANFEVIASDISEQAIHVAKENANMHEVKIDFYVGNMLDPLIEKNIKVDILISNPPYIPEDEEMEQSVVDFEPHVALFGGKDGLRYYKEIFINCKNVLNKNGFMAFEMGWNQKKAMIDLLKQYLPEAKYEIKKDINGKDRMLFVFV